LVFEPFGGEIAKHFNWGISALREGKGFFFPRGMIFRRIDQRPKHRIVLFGEKDREKSLRGEIWPYWGEGFLDQINYVKKALG